MLKKLLPLLLALLFGSTALASEATVKTTIETKLGGKVISVTKTPYLGLYEVYAGNDQIFYTDEKVTTIIAGAILDGKTMKNYTNERLQKLSAIKFSELPLELAVKQVRGNGGNGKRMFATFEDPNCGYCKKLARDIAKLDNVTIYTFLLPMLSQDSLDKSKQIWCSADRAKAWNDWMIESKAPGAAKEDCDTSAINKVVDLAQKYTINGTPTMFFTDGERIPGAVGLERIEQKLSQAAGRK